MTLEEQIKALMEAKSKEAEKEQPDADDKEQADRVDDEPAVKIENPMDPNLQSSETPEGEIAAADAQGEDEDGDTKEVKEESCDKEVKVEESISDLLGDEFSAEFKLKAQTIFEAAVKDQVTQFQAKLQEEHQALAAKLEEEFEDKFLQRSKELQEETSDKIDGYLNFLSEEWKKENAVALEAAIKTELTESFISNLKQVFEQHYVELPEDKVDLYAKTLEEKVEVETALASTVGSLAKLQEELNQIKREQIIEEASKDFASLDQARFKTLTEDFAFEDAETFKTKVGIVKKSFFAQKSTAKEQLTEEFTKTEEIVETQEPVQVVENTAMSRYLSALGGKK